MRIHYKIVEVWPDDHLIVARYWTDVLSEQFLSSSGPDELREDGSPYRCRSDVSITLPVPTPKGQELEEIIMRNAPAYWLTSLEAVRDPEIDTNMQHIMTMMGQTFVKEIKPEDDPNAQVLTDDEIRKLIEKFSTDDKNG